MENLQKEVKSLYPKNLRIPSTISSSTKARRFVQLYDGFAGYSTSYRSVVDTPYNEANLFQHTFTGRMSLSISQRLPIDVSYLIRRSNSRFLRNITDIQISLNTGQLAQGMVDAYKQKLLAILPKLDDSLARKLLEQKKQELFVKKHWLETSFTIQSMVEAKELINYRKLQTRVTDSTQQKFVDSAARKAEALLELYEQGKANTTALQRQVDSLQTIADSLQLTISRLRNLIQQSSDPAELRKTLTTYTRTSLESQDLVKSSDSWLLGIRKLSIGRSFSNHSELTSKNMSVNGVDFEYNSWYFLAGSAGLVDFRFREFAVGKFNWQPQYMVLLRAGIGNIQKNALILSGFYGKKQVFVAGNSGKSGTINVSGYSVQANLRPLRSIFLVAEVAESFSPATPQQQMPPVSKFDFSDRSNKAAALRVVAYFPKSQSKVEGLYKYTGANYQSFTNFQPNATFSQWYVKAEQSVFKRSLKLVASLRSNDYTNPYITQRYSNNTVLKSLSATFRKRRWPVLSVGYLPISQMTFIDSSIFESSFQSFNASFYHNYRVGSIRTATTVIWNHFQNESGDSTFVYYNASNIFLSQNLFFKRFTANAGLSVTRNASFLMTVLEESVQYFLFRSFSATTGLKINNFNREHVKLGGFFHANFSFSNGDILTASYDHGYLPSYNGGLIKNHMGSLQFIKTFRQQHNSSRR